MSRPRSPLPPEARRRLEKAVGYRFRRVGPLVSALTHRSYRHEQIQRGAKAVPETNERLEFLGDAVLDLVITHALLERFPEKNEGELSKLRASLVQEKTLAQLTKEITLADYLLLGDAEDRAGGRGKPSILADAYEALLGAIYLDGGPAKAQKVILGHFEARLAAPSLSRRVSDYKTRLQEITQGRWKSLPLYHMSEAAGPDHQKTFEVECVLDGEVLGRGKATSKKEAGQRAARAAIARLRKQAGPGVKKKRAKP